MTHPTAHEVETFSGRYVDTSDPQADTIVLEDVAHALSQLCRYGGHCRRFYSVAEHAVFVSRRLERKGYSRQVQLMGLHHDDAEAYLQDIVRPIKSLLGVEYERLTLMMDGAICQALFSNRIWPSDFHREVVKDADNWALFVEARHLLPSEGRSWGNHEEGASWADNQPNRIVTPDYWKDGIAPDAAKHLFIKRHKELTA